MEIPDLSINQNQLDKEWIRQPKLFLNYALQATSLQQEVDLLKDELEKVRSKVDQSIRIKGSGVKLTEAMVSAQVVLVPEYTEAINALRSAQSEYAEMKVIVQALEQRKSALENLVRLHGQEYFATPQVSEKEGTRYRENAVKQISRRKLNEK